MGAGDGAFKPGVGGAGAQGREMENPPPCCGEGFMVELSGVEPLTS